MAKVRKSMCMAALLCFWLFSFQATSSAQNIGVPRDPSTSEDDGRQTPSATKTPSANRRVLINIARAVIEVLCAEYGDCPSPSTETAEPRTREGGRYLTPGFADNGVRLAPRERSFSFTPPTGWQTFEDLSSVTVAQPSEYVGGNLTNGVILGLYDLSGGSLESGTEAYVRGLSSANKYLRRIGQPESYIVGQVPCITTRMEGLSPKTQNIEKVVVYSCKRNRQKLFYAVTVNSGPHSGWYDEQNLRITQSVSFRQ